jgi:hypothetical protein
MYAPDHHGRGWASRGSINNGPRGGRRNNEQLRERRVGRAPRCIKNSEGSR